MALYVSGSINILSAISSKYVPPVSLSQPGENNNSAIVSLHWLLKQITRNDHHRFICYKKEDKTLNLMLLLKMTGFEVLGVPKTT